MAAVLVHSRDIKQVTQETKAALPEGRRRAHFSTEGRRVRQQLIKAYSRLDVRSWLRRPPAGRTGEQARQRCLHALLKEFKVTGVHSVALDSRADRDVLDRRYISRVMSNGQAPTDLRYEHRQPTDEPLLGLPDAFVWCYGAGKQWRQYVEPLLRGVFDL